MAKIRVSMMVNELSLKPPIDGMVTLSDDMQQTLALLCAIGVTGRKVLKASESGMLFTASPRVKDVWNETGSGANDDLVGDNIACTECLVMAHPDNAGRLWVKPYKVAAADDGVPLDASDAVNLTVDNLNQVNIRVVVSGDKIVVLYSI